MALATAARRQSCWRARGPRCWWPVSTSGLADARLRCSWPGAAMAGDVTREADCQRMVEAAADRWGRLDLLDNNVGIGSRGSVVDEEPEEYRRVMQINVETMFLLSKDAIPDMI